jgi:hypothetical protein
MPGFADMLGGQAGPGPEPTEQMQMNIKSWEDQDFSDDVIKKNVDKFIQEQADLGDWEQVQKLVRYANPAGGRVDLYSVEEYEKWQQRWQQKQIDAQEAQRRLSDQESREQAEMQRQQQMMQQQMMLQQAANQGYPEGSPGFESFLGGQAPGMGGELPPGMGGELPPGLAEALMGAGGGMPGAGSPDILRPSETDISGMLRGMA